ncbi:MAG: dTDP-glucose 4,6-dehydratase [Pseudomonadota bacterium]|nr:dTDP-glucose 4,6-dehydratase [Pseudomonadota bacterium]
MTRYQPRNVLVTGGAGFIGSHFVRHLLAGDLRVRILNLDLLTYAGSLRNLEHLPDAGRHTFVRGDIRDRPLVDRLLREHRIDTVVHFAAESHVGRSIADPADFIATNLQGTFNLLEACRACWLDEEGRRPGDCRFHHISTDEVYGSLAPGAPAFTEQTAYAPNSPYSATKAGADHLVRSWFHTWGLPVTTSNCSNNYGPHQHREKLMPTVIRACASGAPIPVFGDGSQIRDWLYVEDHCAAVDTVIRQGRVGEVYNIGGDNEWVNIDLVREICAVMDGLLPAGAPHERLIEFVEDRPGHDWRYAIDGTRIREAFGWRPDSDFGERLASTCRWHLDHACDSRQS